MSAHTPGPWVACRRPLATIEYGHHVATHDGLTVCYVSYQVPVLVDGEVVEQTRIANARLIAAAPDMLAALKLYMAWVEAEDDHSKAGFYERLDMCRAADAAARAAIAKAEGRA